VRKCCARGCCGSGGMGCGGRSGNGALIWRVVSLVLSRLALGCVDFSLGGCTRQLPNMMIDLLALVGVVVLSLFWWSSSVHLNTSWSCPMALALLPPTAVRC
jgi:hypothetical protein